jgi:hypothetical protein
MSPWSFHQVVSVKSGRFLVQMRESVSDSAIWTKPASRVVGSGVRFGRAICMLHIIRASSTIRTSVPRSMLGPTGNCCTAMNLPRAIALPNPHAV